MLIVPLVLQIKPEGSLLLEWLNSALFNKIFGKQLIYWAALNCFLGAIFWRSSKSAVNVGMNPPADQVN